MNPKIVIGLVVYFLVMTSGIVHGYESQKYNLFEHKEQIKKDFVVLFSVLIILCLAGTVYGCASGYNPSYIPQKYDQNINQNINQNVHKKTSRSTQTDEFFPPPPPYNYENTSVYPTLHTCVPSAPHYVINEH
jgi:hypothetical protein